MISGPQLSQFDDRLAFYSTSTGCDYKKIDAKFKLHLNSSRSDYSKSGETSSETPSETAHLPQILTRLAVKNYPPRQKQKSGFSKNASSYVEYSKQADETDYSYSKDAFLTNQTADYTRPLSNGKVPLPLKVAQILNSGFTQNCKGFALENDFERFYKDLPTPLLLQTPFTLAQKANIIPSSSGFSSDTPNIKNFGLVTDSPFDCKVLYPRPCALKVVKLPTIMGNNGYTNSTGSSRFEPLGASRFDRAEKTIKSKTLGITSSDAKAFSLLVAIQENRGNIGKKQLSGCIRNNPTEHNE